jgi:hypothetical protein
MKTIREQRQSESNERAPGSRAMTKIIFEPFEVFLKSEDVVSVLVGVRTTQKKYAIISNYKFYKKDTEKLTEFLQAAQNGLFYAAEQLFRDFEDFSWFDSKNEAVNAYLGRFSGFL